MAIYFESKKLSVGYEGKALIKDIDISLEKGRILTLIGPNGAGKSTILKSITRQLDIIGGTVYIGEDELSRMSQKNLAKQMAVVLTDRIRPELMSCEEVVAMGRYPYTNMFGKLTPQDKQAVSDALKKVNAQDLAQQDFMTLSDGQRQRIMLARAICQQPQIIVLDEPTAYLDIRHKVELLDILREMAHNGITVIMSLHEIDLAVKISDLLLCVKGSHIAAFGTPEEILKENTIDNLYQIDKGSYNLLFGSVELAKPKGNPKVFVVAGLGRGIACYRNLQKKEIPFATGIIFENDVDFQVAKDLSDFVVASPAFEMPTEKEFEKAVQIMQDCTAVIDAGTPIGTFNSINQRLLNAAKQKNIPIYTSDKFLEI